MIRWLLISNVATLLSTRLFLSFEPCSKKGPLIFQQDFFRALSAYMGRSLGYAKGPNRQAARI